MKNKVPTLGVISILIAFFCLLIVSTTTSLWFFQALLGNDIGQYSVGYYSSFLESTSIKKDFPAVASGYNRFVYKKDSNGQYIAGIPNMRTLLSLPSELRARGWEAHRIGWIVVASSPGSVSASSSYRAFPRAVGRVLYAFVIKRLPLYPVAVVQVVPGGDEVFSVHVSERRNVLHAVVNTQSIHFDRSRMQRLGSNQTDEGLSYVSIQRDVLQYIPDDILDAIERKISNAMGFTRTHPKILTSFLAFGSVVISEQGDEVGVGVSSDNPQVARQVEQWMHAEQGMRHPIKRAFALPDKTLGYEYVSGGSNALFSLNKVIKNCLPSENYDESLFLCGKSNVLVISNTETLGNNLVSMLEDGTAFKSGIIQGQILDTIDTKGQFQKIEFRNSEQGVEIWAEKTIQKNN